MAARKIKDLGERGFLARLLPSLQRQSSSQFLVPPGDDAAVLRSGAQPILSIDGLTEGTHFLWAWRKVVEKKFKIPFGRALGWKLMGSALSDLASMGQTQHRWAMVYLGAPVWLDERFLSDFYQGVRDTLKKYNCVLAGGDTVRSKELTLVAAVGAERVPARTLLTRQGARPGDLICVAGTVGDAAVGLDLLLKNNRSMPMADQRKFVMRFFQAPALFSDGALLAATSGVSACMDLSDALPECLDLLLTASGCGGVITGHQIPRSRVYQSYFSSLNPYRKSGEDYALLFTAAPQTVARLKPKMRFGVIGVVSSRNSGVKYFIEGKPAGRLSTFQHF